MASKNLIWLSSFFALLFITFCVTRHLDDLNPQITNVAYHDQHDQELPNLTIADTASSRPDNTQATQDPLIVLAEKISAQAAVETLVEKTDVYSSADLQAPSSPELPVTKSQKSLNTPIPTHAIHKAAKVAKTMHIQKTKKQPKIHKKSSTKKVLHITSKSKKKKRKTVPRNHTVNLGSMVVDGALMQRLQHTEEIEQFNKLAYIHNIHKDSIIVMASHNKQAMKKLYRYLIKHHVHAKNIIMTDTTSDDNLIKITLKGRH